MIDIKINESGDFILKPKNVYKNFKIKLSASKYKDFKITFDAYCKNICKTQKNNFTIKFNTSTLIKPRNILNEIDDNELAQAIRINVNTYIKTLKNRINVGTYFDDIKHQNITDDLLETIKLYTENIIKSLNNTNIYTVEVKKEKGDGYFYCQNISVYIYNSDKVLIYSFQIQ